jgi:hypothetical protein
MSHQSKKRFSVNKALKHDFNSFISWRNSYTESRYKHFMHRTITHNLIDTTILNPMSTYLFISVHKGLHLSYWMIMNESLNHLKNRTQ